MTPLQAQSRPILARGVRLTLDPITGGPVLLFPEGVLPLDETTHDIIGRCSGGATLEAIILSLSGEYEAEPDVLRNDVCECLEQLREEMLITIST
jgi:pyrroloquinoline quinone biosynthesis protein D